MSKEKKTCCNCNYFLSSNQGQVCNALYAIADIPISTLNETSYCNEQHWEPREDRIVVPGLTYQIVINEQQHGRNTEIVSNIELPEENERPAFNQERTKVNLKRVISQFWLICSIVLAIALIWLMLLP